MTESIRQVILGKNLSLCVLLLSLFCTGRTQAQSEDTVELLAYYEMRHVIDKEKPSDTLTDVMLLLIGKNSTHFTSYNKLVYGYQAEYAIKQEAEKNRFSDEPFTVKQKMGAFVLDELYVLHKTRRYFKLTFLLDRYLFEANYPVQVWEISADQKTISGLVCQQATTTFKGRDWKVWFSSDVPVNAGPWLLNGLPGLIVQAEDMTGEVVFSLKRLESDFKEIRKSDRVLEAYTHITIGLPKDENINRVSQQEIIKLKGQVRRNLQAYIETRMKANGFMDNPFSISGAWMKPIANPIALSD